MFPYASTPVTEAAKLLHCNPGLLQHRDILRALAPAYFLKGPLFLLLAEFCSLSSKKLWYLDIEHEEFHSLAKWDDFIADPGRYLNGMIEGEFEE